MSETPLPDQIGPHPHPHAGYARLRAVLCRCEGEARHRVRPSATRMGAAGAGGPPPGTAAAATGRTAGGRPGRPGVPYGSATWCRRAVSPAPTARQPAVGGAGPQAGRRRAAAADARRLLRRRLQDDQAQPEGDGRAWRPWSRTGAMVIPVLITLAAGGLRRPVLRLRRGLPRQRVQCVRARGAVSLVSNLGTLFGAVAAGVVLNGMLVRVVAEAVLGRKTSVGEAWAAVRGRLLRLFGLTLLNGSSSMSDSGCRWSSAWSSASRRASERASRLGSRWSSSRSSRSSSCRSAASCSRHRPWCWSASGCSRRMRRATALSQRQFWRLFGISLLTNLVVGLASQVVAIPLGHRRRRGGRGVPGHQWCVGAGVLVVPVPDHRRRDHHALHLARRGPAVRRPADPQGGARRPADRGRAAATAGPLG